MTLLQIMKLLHHSQGYSQYTFIHKYRVSHTTSQWSGPAELACHVVYNWPRGNMVTPACINRQPQQDGGATQRGMEGRGVQCYECLSKHRLNLIHSQCLSISGLCLWGRPLQQQRALCCCVSYNSEAIFCAVGRPWPLTELYLWRLSNPALAQ